MTSVQKWVAIVAFAASVGFVSDIVAQDAGSGGHMQHGRSGGASLKGKATPSSTAYDAAVATMHKDMDITYSGDADVDFVRGMLPHHQGAVDMAKVVLKYGKDPELKKLAAEIVKAQETEISFMKEWLKKKGK